MASEPYELSLLEAATLIRSKELSPVELVDSVLQRIEATEPTINAFATVTAESAKEGARKAEAEITAGRYRGVLHGIPLGVKDLFDVEGLRTGCGSALRKDHVATGTATVVTRLLAAGMVVVGKTNTHEFAYGGITPEVRNPWDARHSPGGSSGGSGAAVASGQCLVATGTDTAGSIRIPAAACGVVGLKPTYGRVPRGGITPLSWSLDTAGALTRNVTDSALVLNAIAGYDSSDPTSLELPVPDYVTDIGAGVRGLRVGVLGGYFTDRVDPEVLEAVERAVRLLEDLGATTEVMVAPFADELLSIQRAIVLPEASAYHQEDLRTRPELYTADVRQVLEAGQFVFATDYVQGQRARALVTTAWRGVFEQVDVVIAPTLPMGAAEVGQVDYDWGSARLERVRDAVIRLTSPANVVGFPALALPIGLSARGLPLSMQLIGPPLSEQRLLQVGRAYETVSDTVGLIAPTVGV